MRETDRAAAMRGRSREQIASDLMLEMRTPLARVELAASQLAREAATPAAAGWAGGISDSVRELDRLAVRVSGLLAVDRSRAGPDEALLPVVSALRTRFAPVLAARGITWEPDSDPDEPVWGDADALRILLVALLRTVSLMADGGGSFSLKLLAEADRVGLALGLNRHRERTPDLPPRDPGVLEDLSAQAFVQGAEVEVREGDDPHLAIVWMPR